MRVVLYLFIVLLFCACLAPEKHRPTTTLVLKDNRGTIKMDLPPSWDTAFQWTHYSDCGLPCARVRYRFQRKAFPIALEDGWLYLKFPLDSVEQLTIIQEAEKQVTKDTVAAIRQFRENIRKSFLMDNHHAHFVIDTIMQVGRHLIPVVGVFNEINHLQICNINALAILKRDGVIFEFKLLAKEQKKGEEHFLAEVMNVIRSVELEE
jgi:hypothetical protein